MTAMQPTCPPLRSRFCPETLDLAPFIAGIVSSMSAKISSHPLGYTGESECYIRGETVALERLVRTLIFHAMSASAPGRPIGIEVWRRENTVCLVVEDEGHGTPPAQTDRLFRPFTRLDSAELATETFGPELLLVHRIARAHDATLAAQGVHGQGTTFEVCFPLSSEPQDSPAVGSVP